MAQTAYGVSPERRERVLDAARQVANTFGQRQLAAAADIALSELSAVVLGKRSSSPSTLAKMCMAVSHLQRVQVGKEERARTMLEEVRRHCKVMGLRQIARRAGIDPANLNRVLKGRVSPSRLILTKLQALLAEKS